jgi:MarR family transcriptional regulator, transcriptional regulator for hemolysin
MGKVTDIFAMQPLGKFLAIIGRKFLNALHVRLKDLEIERNFYALLIIEAGKGRITQQDLAELLDSDKVSVVRIIDYLSNNGYVQRVKDPADKRKYGLNLTAKAEKEMPLIKKGIEEVTKNAFKGLSGEQIEELYRTLNIIKNNLNNTNITN